MKKTKTEVTAALVTIPAKVEAAAVPKPSRKEVIELAAHRLLKREQEAAAKSKAAFDAEDKAVNELILQVMKDNVDKALPLATTDGTDVTLDYNWDPKTRSRKYKDKFQCATLSLEFSDVLPASLAKRFAKAKLAWEEHQKKYCWLEHCYGRSPNGLFKEAVRRVKALMEGVPSEGHRMPTFLADAEMCKAIDSFIAKLEAAQEEAKTTALETTVSAS